MKSVIVFNSIEKNFRVVAHNLDEKKADRIEADLAGKGEHVYLIDQDVRHSGKAADCPDCKGAGLEFLRKELPYIPIESIQEVIYRPAEPLAIGAGRVSQAVEPEANQDGPIFTFVSRNWRKIGAVALGLALVIVSLICVMGPLSPLIQDALLTDKATATEGVAVVVSMPTVEPTDPPVPQPSATPRIVQTTTAPLTEPEASPTAEIPTPTGTATPTEPSLDCMMAEDVTIENTGEVICVQGTVSRAYFQEPAFYIIFAADYESFYMVSYDQRFDSLEPGDCVYATGEIKQLQLDPIMVLGPRDKLERCP